MENNAHDLHVHILGLNCPNCPKLPFTNTPLNCKFVTLEIFKLPFNWDLAPPLDVGVKMDSKCRTWLTRAYIRLKYIQIIPVLEEKWRERERERLTTFRGWPNTLWRFLGLDDNPLKIEGVGDYPVKAFGNGQIEVDWWSTTQKACGAATSCFVGSIRSSPKDLRGWSTMRVFVTEGGRSTCFWGCEPPLSLEWMFG